MTFPLAEHLVFSPVGDDRARAVARRIRLAVSVGVLSEGQPLPSEQEMAARLGVSATTLRAALAELREGGWIETRRGRGGGSFLLGAAPSMDMWNLMDLEPEDIRDLGDHHAAVAGGVAALASERAHGPVLERLERHALDIENKDDAFARARSDCRFHIELAAATRSTRLAATELTTQAEITPLIWSYMNSPAACEQAREEHRAIMSAIRARDADRARHLAHLHTVQGVDYLIQRRLDAELASAGIEATRGTADAPVAIATKDVVAAVTAEAESWTEALDWLSDAVAADFSRRPIGVAEMVTTAAAAARLLDDQKRGLFAAGFVALPDTFPGSGGEVWLRRSLHDANVHQVEASFFATGTTPWWSETVRDERVHTTGPYVDASGTDQYVFTVSRRVTADGRSGEGGGDPVGTAGDRLVGVVAVDVTVRVLQRRLHPYLALLPLGSCIADDEGGVLVTGTGELIGRRLRDSPSVAGANIIPSTGWNVVIGGATASPTPN